MNISFIKMLIILSLKLKAISTQGGYCATDIDCDQNGGVCDLISQSCYCYQGFYGLNCQYGNYCE